MDVTVKELIEQLKGCAPDAIVVLAKDNEGNGFSPFCDIGRGAAVALCPWAYDVATYDKLHELEPGKQFDVIVLWPTPR